MAGQETLLEGLEAKIKDGTSSIFVSILNVTKTCIGAGILSLIHALCQSPRDTHFEPIIELFESHRFPWAFHYGSLWPSIAICIYSAIYCLISGMLIIHGCETTGKFEYSALLRSVGPRFQKAGVISIGYVAFNCCLGYCILIPQFLQPAFSELFDIARFQNDRQMYILIAAALILYPLCLLKDLSSLRYSSVLGLMAVFYCLGLFVYDAIEHYHSGEAPGTASDPNAEFLTNQWSTGIFIVVNVASKAFTCHYTLPSIYESLRNRSIKRMRIVMTVSFMVVTVVYVTFAVCGYYLFGSDSQGNVLENFRGEAGLTVSVARLGTAVSIIGCFPLIFKAGLNAMETQFFSDPNSRFNFNQNPTVRVSVITLLLMTMTGLSCFIDDVGPVSSIEGAIAVLFLLCSFPILIYWRVVLEGDRGHTDNNTVQKVKSHSVSGHDAIMLEESSGISEQKDEVEKEANQAGSSMFNGMDCRLWALGFLFIMGIASGAAGLVMSLVIIGKTDSDTDSLTMSPTASPTMSPI